MTVVRIVRDEYAPSSEWEDYETDWPLEFLMEKLGTWPENARLYHGSISKATDVTPTDEADLAALAHAPGPLIAVLHAAGFDPFSTTALLIYAAVLGVAGAVAGFLLQPKVPNQNQVASSSNNTLGARTNQARVGQRVPDILGEKLCVPDLIGVPLRMFDANNEFELAPMVLGRGSYTIDAADVKDGGTPVSEIAGASVEFYGPNTSPNSGDAPQLTIGDPISTGMVTVYKIDGVNGQTLLPYLYKTIDSAVTGNLRFLFPNFIMSDDADGLNFSKYVEAGDTVVLAGAHDTKSGQTVNLDGTYVVDTVNSTGDRVALLNVTSVTTDWNKLDLMASDRTNLLPSCTVNASGLSSLTVGPFFADVPDATGMVLNFVALGGLYKTNGKESVPVPVSIDIGATSVDESGTPTGPEIVHTVTMPGSGVNKSQQACTALIPIAGRSSIRALRDTQTDYAYNGTVTDEVKWRDLFITAPIGVEHFGDVTTVWAKQSVTQAALGVKERKLTALATRKLPARDGDGFDDDTLVATRDAADIICHIARDPLLGRRADSEINVVQIRETIAAVKAYFGDDAFGEFGFSFDDDQISAEQMIDLVAAAVFCDDVRRGSVLELVFEQPTEDSAMLFNHRNILPRSQKRQANFGSYKRFDGAEATYLDATDSDTPKTIRIPEDGSARNPQKLDLSGVRNFSPAWALTMRAYNKARYQRWLTEFDATAEANAITRLQRIAVANTARKFDGMSGEVTAQDGLNLTLSQAPRWADDTAYVIMLQYADGTVGVIDVTPGVGAKQVVLAEPPAVDLSTDIRNFVRTLYWILPDDESDAGRAFLLTEKARADANNYHMTAINYDRRYYANDLDAYAGLLNAGNPLASLGTMLLDLVG